MSKYQEEMWTLRGNVDLLCVEHFQVIMDVLFLDGQDFYTKLVYEMPELANFGYLPVIDNPATDLATINAIFKKSICMCESLHIPEIVVVFDETIYVKAQMVR